MILQPTGRRYGVYLMPGVQVTFYAVTGLPASTDHMAGTWTRTNLDGAWTRTNLKGAV